MQYWIRWATGGLYDEPVRLCLVEPERFSYQFGVGAIFVHPRYVLSNNLNLRLSIGTAVFLKCTGIYVLRVSAAQKDHEADPVPVAVDLSHCSGHEATLTFS